MTTIRAKLTKRVVDATHEEADHDVFVWDTEVKGFRLRVRPTGRKTYELKYRVGSRQKLLVIGDHGDTFTADEARKRAGRAKQLSKDGGDPLAEKRAARNAKTVAELVEQYLREGPIDRPQKREASWKTDAIGLRRHATPLLGSISLTDLTPADLSQWQADVAAGKTARDQKLGRRSRSIVRGGRGAAARAMRVLSAALSFAVRRGMLKTNPASRVEKVQDGKRERFLTDAEARHLWDVIAEMEATETLRSDHADFFRLIAITGARRSEILELRWGEVDLDRRMLVLPPDRHKTGRGGTPKVINLHDEAVSILSGLKNKTPWVFPKLDAKAGPIEPPKRAWLAVVARAGLGAFRLHDLRHTYASLLVKEGHALAIVGKALGHAKPTTTARYAHLRDDATRAAVDHVGGVFTAKPSGESVH